MHFFGKSLCARSKLFDIYIYLSQFILSSWAYYCNDFIRIIAIDIGNNKKVKKNCKHEL